MHKNAFSVRHPGPAGGAYSTDPDPIAGLKGKGRENRKGDRKEREVSPMSEVC